MGEPTFQIVPAVTEEWATSDTSPALGPPLPRAFYARQTQEVALALLGAYLVHDTPEGRQVGRIVETEAYVGLSDRASHASRGRTRRTDVMFGPPGYAYVYLVYGMHYCLNVVSERDGEAGAVLLRALVPMFGVEQMRARRGRFAEADVRLAAGPGRLCQALGVDLALDRVDLCTPGELWLAKPSETELAQHRRPGIVTGSRVGVESAGEEAAARPWRFGIRGHPSLSRPFRSPAR